MVPEQYGEPSSLEVDALTPKIMFQSGKRTDVAPTIFYVFRMCLLIQITSSLK